MTGPLIGFFVVSIVLPSIFALIVYRNSCAKCGLPGFKCECTRDDYISGKP